MKQSRALKSLIASRTAFGVAAYVCPVPVGKALGVDLSGDPMGITCRACWACGTSLSLGSFA
jgi:hypothetical protein